ncbi:unnamed protein product [Camellia sinensis]
MRATTPPDELRSTIATSSPYQPPSFQIWSDRVRLGLDRKIRAHEIYADSVEIYTFGYIKVLFGSQHQGLVRLHRDLLAPLTFDFSHCRIRILRQGPTVASNRPVHPCAVQSIGSIPVRHRR